MSRFTVTLPSLPRTLSTGVIAASAYLAVMGVDMRITHNRYNDLVFWGGYVSRDARRQRVVGATIIYGVGTVVAAVYATLLPVLPRWPGWLLGATFVQSENTFRWPTVIPMNAIHPSVHRGELPSLWTWQYFWVEAGRHIAFGIVLGLLTRRRDR